MRGEPDESKGEHEDVGCVRQTIPVDDHLVALALAVTELVDDGEVRDLHGSPADIEDRRPDQIPYVLAGVATKEGEAHEDAEL